MDWYSFSLIDLETLTTPKIIERGREYYNEGHLAHACKFENVLAGVLLGANGNYKARLWIHGREIFGECSCPFPAFCKHLAALAIAWVEQKNEFTDLQPIVNNILNDFSKLQNTFIELVQRDPTSLMNHVLTANGSNSQAYPSFNNSRAIINLTRNIFGSIRLTLTNTDILSERIMRAENLVTEILEQGDPDAIEPLGELLYSLALTYKDYQSAILVESFKHLLHAVEKTLSSFTPGSLQPLLEILLEIYFDPVLWEFNIPMREILSKYLECNNSFLENFLKAKIEDSENVIALVSVYEILDLASKEINYVKIQLQEVTRKLLSTTKGCLWLIDRLMDSDLEKAYKIAKKGIYGGGESVSSYRERLINIHLKRNELRQAAALSFVQFKDSPNFDEYLRLKTILAKRPNDFKVYSKQIKDMLINSNMEKLLIQIMIDQQDYENIIKYLPEITAEPSLLRMAAEMISGNILEQFKEIYPVIIRAFLKDEGLSNTKEASSLLLAYKKLCFQTGAYKEWDIFREQLFQEVNDGLNILKKADFILLPIHG